MNIFFSTLCMYILSISVLSWAMPMLYTTLFVKDVPKTQMFYSAIDKKFIYTEQILVRDIKAEEKSQGHHADIIYKDEDDNYYTRLEFEAKIPFIYYRNMEMRGLLPLHIDGKTFDRAAIQKARRVFEIPARRLDDKIYAEGIYPLLESNPDQVALVLPADRFRMTNTALQFIDSDHNAVDPVRTKQYTNALLDKGFVFPSQGLWGNFTTFKPYDGGIFIVDAHGKTFHILRYNDTPKVEAVPFPSDIVPKKIIISEAADKQLYGLVLDTEDRLYILHTKDYALTYMPTPAYTPDTMDIKVIMDPLHITLVYADHVHTHSVVYNNTIANTAGVALNSVREYTHSMAKAETTPHSVLYGILFPFTISFSAENSTLGVFNLLLSTYYVPFGLLLNVVLALVYMLYYRRQHYSTSMAQQVCIVIFGIYVLIPMLLMVQRGNLLKK